MIRLNLTTAEAVALVDRLSRMWFKPASIVMVLIDTLKRGLKDERDNPDAVSDGSEELLAAHQDQLLVQSTSDSWRRRYMEEHDECRRQGSLRSDLQGQLKTMTEDRDEYVTLVRDLRVEVIALRAKSP